jgi:hypothetical protein
MATGRLRIGRDQLASFLKDHEAIRQFERLFTDVEQLEPTTLADIILTLATAENKAGEALDAVEKLRREIELSVPRVEQPVDALDDPRIVQLVTQPVDALDDPRIVQLVTQIDDLRKQVDALQSAPPPREFKRARYGQFYDTTPQTATAINTPEAVTFNTTDVSNGVYIGSPTSRIYVDEHSIYNFLFSIQLDKTSGGSGIFWVWPRINGVDVPDSNSQIQIQGNDAEQLVTVGYFFDLKAGDYVEIMFAVNDTTVQMDYFPASAFYPAIPSIILTVSNNIQGVQ